jgi:hypothetical protein
MNDRHDDDLRARLQQLGREEGAAAPSFDRVLRARATPAGLVDRWRLAVAIAGMALIAVLAWWRPKPPTEGPEIAQRPRPTRAAPAPDWGLPTDALLVDVEDESTDVDQLSRDIEGLLKP